MATITTRSGKGSPLTNTEVDNNFENLNTAKYESGDSISVSGFNFTAANPSLNITANTDNWAAVNIQAGDTQANYVFFRDADAERARITVLNNNDFSFSTGSNVQRLKLSATAAIFNETGADTNFRVETVANSNAFVVDAGDDQVMTHTNSPLKASEYGFFARRGAIVGNYSGNGSGLTVYRGDSLQTNINHDSTKGYVSTGGNPLHFRTDFTSADYKLSVLADGVVINENGNDYDFRVESDTEEYALFLQGSDGFVGVHTSTPAAELDVAGTVKADRYEVDAVYPTIRPSLLMDFANSKTLDPRVSFTRSTTATYWDGHSTVKAEENLFTYSENFGNGNWNKSNSTITQNQATSPKGDTTADLYTVTGAGDLLQRNLKTRATTYTWSVFAKAGSLSTVDLGLIDQGTTSIRCSYNLSNGTTSQVAGTGATHQMWAVGNGWYRLVLRYTLSVGNNSNGDTFQIRSPSGAANNSTFYIWGAQLEERDGATNYVYTSDKVVQNFQPKLMTAGTDVPRFDHDPVTRECKGLLLEESRTNVAQYSSDMSNWWSLDNLTYKTDTGVAPDGTLTALLISPDGTSNRHRLSRGFSTSVGSTYCLSVYVKSIGGGTCYLNAGAKLNATAGFELSGEGSVEYSGGGNYWEGIQNCGNGWYRVWVVGQALDSTNPVFIQVQDANSYTDVSWGSGEYYTGLLVWGAQFENGPGPTSLIPTAGASVARGVEVALIDNLSSSDWYSYGQGTSFVEAAVGQYQTSQGFMSFFEEGNGNDWHGFYSNTPGSDSTAAYTANAYNVSYTAPGGGSSANAGVSNVPAGQFMKMGHAWSPDVVRTAFDGLTTENLDLGARVTPHTQLRFEKLYQSGFPVKQAHIKKYAFYQEALSTANLKALTEA